MTMNNELPEEDKELIAGLIDGKIVNEKEKILDLLKAELHFNKATNNKFVAIFDISIEVVSIKMKWSGFTIRKSAEGNLFVAPPVLWHSKTALFRIEEKDYWHKFNNEVIEKYQSSNINI